MTRFRGAIFDVDGVLVDSPHLTAWQAALRELMENGWRDLLERSTWRPDAFTPLVYQEHVSGKPRSAGARDSLVYFGLPHDDAHVREYAQRKANIMVRLIEAGDFTAYPDALRFMIIVKQAGAGVAAASSSRNTSRLLHKIRLDTFAEENGIVSPTIHPGMTLLEYFDVDVSGRDFHMGKPHPEMFLTAAHELGVEPPAAFVVEDAVAGVQAAKAGGMSAIGVARAHDAHLLAYAGADLVVANLDEVDRDALAHGRLANLGDA